MHVLYSKALCYATHPATWYAMFWHSTYYSGPEVSTTATLQQQQHSSFEGQRLLVYGPRYRLNCKTLISKLCMHLCSSAQAGYDAFLSVSMSMLWCLKQLIVKDMLHDCQTASTKIVWRQNQTSSGTVLGFTLLCASAHHNQLEGKLVSPHSPHMLLQDVAMVCQRVRAAAVVYDSAEGRALSPSKTRPPSPRKEGSSPNSPKREAAPEGPTVSFHVVTQVSPFGPPCLSV